MNTGLDNRHGAGPEPLPCPHNSAIACSLSRRTGRASPKKTKTPQTQSQSAPLEAKDENAPDLHVVSLLLTVSPRRSRASSPPLEPPGPHPKITFRLKRLESLASRMHHLRIWRDFWVAEPVAGIAG